MTAQGRSRGRDVWGSGIGLIAAGGAAATGFQPLALWPATLLALAYCIGRIEAARSPLRAAGSGWLFGLGLFAVGNNWIAKAFTYQAQMPAWLGWIAVLLLASYLAIFPALAAWAAAMLARRRQAALVPALAAFWIIAEWLRAWAFTGFPWNPLAVVALGPFSRPGLSLIAPWLGTYALSGLVVLLAGQWLFAARAAKLQKWRAAAIHALLPGALFLLPLGGSGEEGTLAFTLVQPNTPQDQINDAARFEDHFRTTAGLSLPVNPAQTRLVLWPEGGVPDYLRPGYAPIWYAQSTYGADPALARSRMGKVIGPRSLLLTGATDLAQQNGRIVGASNVVTALDGRGTIRGSYSKAHLVPYGEYLPMRPILESIGLSRLVGGTVDFLAGPGPRTTDFGNPAKGGWGKAGVQVCYEIIFSGEVTDRSARPDYIFNPSIDGWFGAWGPPQHLAQARMRAIEEGLPVLRSTTTGISAVIDADGVVRQFLPLGVAGRLDGMVPPAHPPTLFARIGNALALIWAALLLVCAIMVASAKRSR
ncbi:apolipoprotein N-acyltransferase [Novosphingobium sp. Chol11]|uniref:apolipoprotein N-acyltransferase n=1 Tax=Novosphingobium sp. Chol11 TaxID=1385763 RepID=UPI0025F84445|nr:apolipoprotein N-acyltransferase [Novosphingobium sp. Chol11]